jgi:hypothetical protein
MNESIFFLASIAVFAMLGLLTGFVHGHGEIVGTICGGLAGIVLAIFVPAVVSTSFMTNRKPLQYFIALVALSSLLLVVCWAYNIIG